MYHRRFLREGTVHLCCEFAFRMDSQANRIRANPTAIGTWHKYGLSATQVGAIPKVKVNTLATFEFPHVQSYKGRDPLDDV